MYSGTLIDDLMATVARAEENVQLKADFEKEFSYSREVAPYPFRASEQDLLGVA